MSVLARRPSPLAIRLLRLEYWYDRLSEPQRFLVGLFTIAVLGTCWLYVLGLGSVLLVSQASEVQEVVADPTTVVVYATVEQPAEVAAVKPQSTPTATPAVVSHDALIAPPEVPEVAIVPPAPRYVAPAQTVKPRMVAATPTPQRLVTPVPVTPTRAIAVPNGAPSPVPQRTAAPTNGVRTPPTQTSRPTSGPTAGTTPTRAPAATPVIPTLVPTTSRPPVVTATPARVR